MKLPIVLKIPKIRLFIYYLKGPNCSMIPSFIWSLPQTHSRTIKWLNKDKFQLIKWWFICRLHHTLKKKSLPIHRHMQTQTKTQINEGIILWSLHNPSQVPSNLIEFSLCLAYHCVQFSCTKCFAWAKPNFSI